MLSLNTLWLHSMVLETTLFDLGFFWGCRNPFFLDHIWHSGTKWLKGEGRAVKG